MIRVFAFIADHWNNFALAAAVGVVEVQILYVAIHFHVTKAHIGGKKRRRIEWTPILAFTLVFLTLFCSIMTIVGFLAPYILELDAWMMS